MEQDKDRLFDEEFIKEDKALKQKMKQMINDIEDQNTLLQIQNDKLKYIIDDIKNENALLTMKVNKLEATIEYNLKSKEKEDKLNRTLRFLWRFQQVLILVLLCLSILFRH